MNDVIYVGLTLLFLALTYGLIVLCETVDGGQIMNPLYVIGGLISLGLFIYLVLALLKPEWFG